MIKLNLGCGKDILKDFENYDIKPTRGAKKIDLNKIPYPFKDNHADYILLRHVFEHLADLNITLKELKRITKNNGEIKIVVPHFSSQAAYNDITHKHFFGYVSENLEVERAGITMRKLVFGRLHKIIGLEWFFNKAPYIYERLFCWIFPCREIQFRIRVTK